MQWIIRSGGAIIFLFALLLLIIHIKGEIRNKRLIKQRQEDDVFIKKIKPIFEEERFIGVKAISKWGGGVQVRIAGWVETQALISML